MENNKYTFNNRINNGIRGSYSYSQNSNNQDDYSSIYCIYNLNELIQSYNKEKTLIEKDILQLELINIDLLKHISFFDKRYCLVNITHSNTANFIIANYKPLKYILDKLIFMYDTNLDIIYAKKEKLNNIILTINTLKLDN